MKNTDIKEQNNYLRKIATTTKKLSLTSAVLKGEYIRTGQRPIFMRAGLQLGYTGWSWLLHHWELVKSGFY